MNNLNYNSEYNIITFKNKILNLLYKKSNKTKNIKKEIYHFNLNIIILM